LKYWTKPDIGCFIGTADEGGTLDKELTDKELQFLMPWSWRRNARSLRRTIHGLPRLPGARREHGIEAHDRERFVLKLESTSSEMIQGVSLVTDVDIRVAGTPYKHGMTIFFGPEANPELEARPNFLSQGTIRNPDGHAILFECRTREGMLWVWNVWEYYSQGARIVLSHSMYSGILVEELPNGYRYRCNEGRDDDDYDDLVFRIERMGEIPPPQKS
jgi:hypothetical protein